MKPLEPVNLLTTGVMLAWQHNNRQKEGNRSLAREKWNDGWGRCNMETRKQQQTVKAYQRIDPNSEKTLNVPITCNLNLLSFS